MYFINNSGEKQFPVTKRNLFLLLTLLLVGILALYIRNRQAAETILRLSETEPAYEQSAADFGHMEPRQNPYADLSVPTYVTKIEDTFFIVDCYHNQIIYSDSLERPLYEWNIMTDQINKGHTLACDGVVWLTDDTENHRILVFEKKGDMFVHTQTLPDTGVRPHYIVYHEEKQCFYAWSSMTGEMYLLRREEDSSRVYISKILKIPTLDGIYVRSFTILEDDIYFVSGNSSIIRADLDTFEIREEYPVPDALAGMVQLTWIDSYWYITVSTDKQGNQEAATILRTDDLHKLAASDYEDVYAAFIGGGTPYYISYVEDRYYLTEHRLPGHSVWSFRSENGQLQDITAIY